MVKRVVGRFLCRYSGGPAINALASGIGGFRLRKQSGTTACLICPETATATLLLVVVCYFLHSAGCGPVINLLPATFGGAGFQPRSRQG